MAVQAVTYMHKVNVKAEGLTHLNSYYYIFVWTASLPRSALGRAPTHPGARKAVASPGQAVLSNH